MNGEATPSERPLKSLSLGAPWLTAAYWGAIAIFAIAFLIPRFPPCIDYPQHVALGALLNRLWRGSAEAALYDVDLQTYNGGFHVAVAVLSYVVRPELAGKVLLALIPLLSGYAWLEVIKLSDRPRWYAFFLLPFCYSNVVGWGFINYALGVPLGMLLLTLWVRFHHGETRLAAWLVPGALLLAYTHVLAMLCFCISVGVAWLAAPGPREWGARRWALGAARGIAPLVPALLFDVSVFLHQRQQSNFALEDRDGFDRPLWFKLWKFLSYAVGNQSGGRDQLILGLLLAALLGLFLLPRFVEPLPTRRRPELVALGVAWLLLYGVVPEIIISTAFIFERLPVWAVTFVAPLAPVFAPRVLEYFRAPVVALGLASAVGTASAFTRLPDEADADAMLDEIPENARVYAVMHDNASDPAIQRRIWVHYVAYYLARRAGETDYTFTKFASMPVRYKTEQRPPLIPGGYEWMPWVYDVTADYARRYPTVLVRTPYDHPDRDPRELTFKSHAGQVKTLAHHGRLWLYDVSAVWADDPPEP